MRAGNIVKTLILGNLLTAAQMAIVEPSNTGHSLSREARRRFVTPFTALGRDVEAGALW